MNERSRALAAHRRALLALPPRERIDAILSAEDPGALVRALPPQDLFLSVAAAGRDAALPLLPLTTQRQADLFIDLDAWSEDRFEPEGLAHWIEAFAAADPSLVARWLLESEEENVVLGLHRLVHVYKLDESTSEDFWPPDRPLPTLDGLYFLEPREEAGEKVFAALWEGLARVRERATHAYEALLEQVLWIVPAEKEEEAYERRLSRLAELGFPEPDEALDAWAAGALTERERRGMIGARVRELPLPEAARERLEAGLASWGALAAGREGVGPGPDPAEETGGALGLALPLPLESEAAGRVPLLARALPLVDDDTRDRFALGVARLANRFAVSSKRSLGALDTHREALVHALSHMHLAVEEIARDEPADAARALTHLPPAELARLGAGAVMERARRARRLAESGWLARVHLAHERLDPTLAAPLAGLLAPRPHLSADDLPRPFARAAELEHADLVLDALDALGAFLVERLGARGGELPELETLPARREHAADVEWSAVLLTALARRSLGEAPRPRALTREEARVALDLLLAGGPPRRVSERFDALIREEKLEALRWLLAARLEDDAAGATPGALPDTRFLRALLFRL